MTMAVAPAVSWLVRHFVAVQWGQSSLGCGLVVLMLSGSLGSQGPVGRQHRQPDGHGDQDQEGRGGEGDERWEELLLRRNVRYFLSFQQEFTWSRR